MTRVSEKVHPAPQKRVFAPEPSVDATHFFEHAGPERTICVHRIKGFHLGTVAGQHIWSHQEPMATVLVATHPDFARACSDWPDRDSAANYFHQTVSWEEWSHLSFPTVKADIAESSERRYPGFDNMPIPKVSIETASRLTGSFAPLDIHLLDPQMRRSRKPAPLSASTPIARKA